MVALIALGSAGFGTAAMADSFTESVQFGVGSLDFANSSGTTAGPNGNMLYYFDSNGGTLTSITVSYGYSFSSQITVTSGFGGGANGTVNTKSGAQFGSSASAITTALNGYVNNIVDLVDGTTVSFGNTTLTPIAADVRGAVSMYNLSAGASSNYTSAGSFSRGPYTVSDASFLAAFSMAGGGTFTPLFTTLTGSELEAFGGEASQSEVATAQGNLALTFNYTQGVPQPTAVPEPGTIVLLGAGLLGLGLVRRGTGRRGAD